MEKTEIVKFKFNETTVEFEPSNKNVMVNATQMAKIFGKEIKQFNELESTKKFINTCLISRDSRLIGIEKKEDLIISKKNSGTWMHRILALKFAAWLDPNFDVWVYATIDQLLFGQMGERFKILDEKANYEYKLQKAMEKLKDSEAYQEVERIKEENKKLTKRVNKMDQDVINKQLSLLFENEANN